MLGNLLQPEIREIIERRDFARLKELFADWAPADIAELLQDLPSADRLILFRLLQREKAADVFEYLSFETQEAMLKDMGGEAASVLDDMAPDDRTALLEELPGPVCARLIQMLSPEERRTATALLNYPDQSVGRLMTSDYFTIRDEWTAQEVLDHIRVHGRDSETLNVLYVVDDAGRLLDDVRLRNLLLCRADQRVRDIRDNSYVALKPTDDQEKAVEIFRRYDRTAIPVTDGQGILVGIVTVDDVLDVAEEEATEDMQKMGGMEALDVPYLHVGLPAMIQKRVGWLVVLFFGQMLTATAIAHYEADLAKALVLALFIPLIISSGGNSGSQASTLVIRAMAMGDVALKDWFRVLRRELLLGLSMGGVLAVIGFLRIVLWPNRAAHYTDHYIAVGLVVGLSLVGVVAFGCLVGAMLPFFLRRLKLDPATSSAPFVATMVDVTGLFIYFSVAQALLRGSLL